MFLAIINDFCAVAGPIPGKVSKSSFVAVLILIKLEDELLLGLLELVSFTCSLD